MAEEQRQQYCQCGALLVPGQGHSGRCGACCYEILQNENELDWQSISLQRETTRKQNPLRRRWLGGGR